MPLDVVRQPAIEVTPQTSDLAEFDRSSLKESENQESMKPGGTVDGIGT